MAEAHYGSEERDWAMRALMRLASARWVVAAAIAAIGALGVAAGAPATWTILASVFVAAAAAFAPRLTARQRAERQAEAASPALGAITVENLAAAVPDPLVIVDREGAVVRANRAARAAFSQLAPGTSLTLRFRAAEMQELIGRLLDEGRGGAIDYAERVPVERWFRVTAAPVGTGTGLFVLVFKDQSEARRIDRMRADFIANASHELRTPLASVAGFIETLRGPARNDENAREQFLQIMQNQTDRMARLIDDLLSLSRLEMKSTLAGGEQVDLRALIAGVVDALNPLAADSGVTIELNLGDEPAMVAGSRDELIQVFENLVENACKYGQDGGRAIVTIDRVPEGGGLEVSVRDFGPGIPEEHIPRLTERFYRADIETSRVQKGTGLGLAIVKHILTRHGARLSIRSQPGEGATFTVHFPPQPAG